MHGPYDWYFEFISPFSWLQWARLRRGHHGLATHRKLHRNMLQLPDPDHA